MSRALDVVILVPFPAGDSAILNSEFRQTIGGPMFQLVQACAEFERYLGLRLRSPRPEGVSSGNPEIDELLLAARHRPGVQRSLSALTLASAVDHANLAWAAIDPGPRDLAWWRQKLRSFSAQRPAVIAIDSSFIQSAPWLQSLIWIARRELPGSRIALGGYHYASSTVDFLSLDADVLCVGEGELRLPQIVAAIRDGRSMTDIPGLYLRNEGGRLLFTGPAEELRMDDIPPVRYELAARIDPPIDLERDAPVYGVETQRGCHFRCEFCTYRTMSQPRGLSPAAAARAILSTRVSRRGYVALTDATACFPHERWHELLTHLIEAGGSPYPMWVCARVSDINEQRADLMARAGVRGVMVGQESGDDRILRAMHKGTSVAQIPAAVATLGRHGIAMEFSFIHGFPGEDADSVAATRRCVTSLNEAHKDAPVVLAYYVQPFQVQSLASVSKHEGLSPTDHGFDYAVNGFSGRRAAEEVLATIVATSRVPHAPANRYVLSMFLDGDNGGIPFLLAPGRLPLFRFAKTLERGLAIFLESALEGTPVDDRALRQIREEVMRRLPPASADRRLLARARRSAEPHIYARLVDEFTHESQAGTGLLTRTALAAMTQRVTGGVAAASRSWATARFPSLGPSRKDPAIERLAAELAIESTRAARGAGRA